MGEFFTKLRTQIADIFKKMTRGQRIRLAILSVLVLAIIIVAAVFLGRTPYAVLYSDLEPEDAGTVMAQLEEQGIEARTQGDDTILVPAEQADALRMSMALIEGYPASGQNYDIYLNNAMGMGTTQADKNQLMEFQLQERLKKSLETINKVEQATLTISMGDSSPFVLDAAAKEASASVLLSLQDGQALTKNEARAIFETVAYSVQGLDPANVSLIDTDMRTYTYDGTGSPAMMAEENMTMEQEVEYRLEDNIIELLTPVFGEGRVEAQVSAKLNFDQITTERRVFEPPIEGETEGIARSVERLYENVLNYAEGGEVGTGTNNVGTPVYPTDGTGQSVYEKTHDIINYELNETYQIIQEANGDVESLEVAVLIDENAPGAVDYQSEVAPLVARAVGTPQENIQVSVMPFEDQVSELETIQQLQEERINAMQSSATMRMIILAAAIVIVAVLLFLMVRSFRKAAAPVPQAEMLDALGQQVDLMVGEDGMPIGEEDEDEITMQGPSGPRAQIEKFIDKNPDSAAQLLRNWLTEDY